jgi:predicted transcriptional regulator
MPPRPSRQLTKREREIMDILYRLGRASAHEVLENLAEPPSYSAVRALLKLLEQRGHAKHVQSGTRYVYMPVVARHEARRSALSHVVKTFFAGSVEHAMATLVDSARTKLSNEELDRIAELIHRAKQEGR